ncbi:MAG: hypothetical protein KatS3mg119_1663 [Rhodothalassiaceae bacterium]|nr:MAG: hypothetical protein KatS3mg119_1663 [Rhodothalassiaceae bacterium]
MPPEMTPPTTMSPTRQRAGWSRRRLLRAGGGAALALPYLVAGRWRLLTPREARAAGASLRVLGQRQAQALAALAETLVPGAEADGVVFYLDAQLAADPADSLLILRYLDVPPPWDAFYRATAAAIDHVAGEDGFAALASDTRARLVSDLMAGRAGDWPQDAPPAGLALFVLRADAVDVVWGTPEGFARLGIDYLPHIAPARPW